MKEKNIKGSFANPLDQLCVGLSWKRRRILYVWEKRVSWNSFTLFLLMNTWTVFLLPFCCSLCESKCEPPPSLLSKMYIFKNHVVCLLFFLNVRLTHTHFSSPKDTFSLERRRIWRKNIFNLLFPSKWTHYYQPNHHQQDYRGSVAPRVLSFILYYKALMRYWTQDLKHCIFLSLHFFGESHTKKKCSQCWFFSYKLFFFFFFLCETNFKLQDQYQGFTKIQGCKVIFQQSLSTNFM